jgi:acyl dehydratase
MPNPLRQRQTHDQHEDLMQYFEDLEVGTITRFGRYEVTREEVLEFANKFDPQAFHLSDEAAAETHFGKISASGWHTGAMTMSMIVGNMQNHRQATLGSPGFDELRWLKPVYPGDTLRCETELLDKTPSKSRPNMGSLRIRNTVYNQDDVPVMRAVFIELIARRPTDATRG